MLASTVQFSNNNRNSSPTALPNTEHSQNPKRATSRLMQKQGKAQERNTQHNVRRHHIARPLRTQQRTYSPPTPSPPVPTPTTHSEEQSNDTRINRHPRSKPRKSRTRHEETL